MPEDEMPDEDETLDHHVPADLLELFEVIEWNEAVDAQQKSMLPDDGGSDAT